MYIGNQTTILNPVYFFGKPKNSQRIINVKILPAEINTGIVFKRIDLKDNNIINLNYDNVVVEDDEIILKNEYFSIYNIELLLASIWASRIDNLVIELDGDSIPYIDGTSEPISFLLATGMLKESEKLRSIFEMEQELGMKKGESEINLKQNKALKVIINNNNEIFEFDNSVLPFKDSLSIVSKESNEKLKLNVISAIAIIFISGKYYNFEVEFKNFDKKIAFNFFKNFLNNFK